MRGSCRRSEEIEGQLLFRCISVPLFSTVRPHASWTTRRTRHVLNRGNGDAVVFHKDADYTAFLALLQIAKSKYRGTGKGVGSLYLFGLQELRLPTPVFS